MSKLTLVSFNICPFVQRAAILLEEQKRSYEIEYIDLQNKPDWFLEISPSGKVPVLKIDDTPLFESAVILEYLDETSDKHRLLPENPLARAQQRMWITYISNIMTKGWLLQSAGEEEKAREMVEGIRGHLQDLGKELPESGPYWGGETYTMVDVAVAPILQRLDWADKLEPTLGIFDGLQKVASWRDALLARPSTSSSILPDLEQRNGKFLHSIGSWIARGVQN